MKHAKIYITMRFLKLVSVALILVLVFNLQASAESFSCNFGKKFVGGSQISSYAGSTDSSDEGNLIEFKKVQTGDYAIVLLFLLDPDKTYSLNTSYNIVGDGNYSNDGVPMNMAYLQVSSPTKAKVSISHTRSKASGIIRFTGISNNEVQGEFNFFTDLALGTMNRRGQIRLNGNVKTFTITNGQFSIPLSYINIE